MDTEKQKQNLSRKKIINSAIVLFSNKGFESTSTREICRHAGVNLSLIPYYFGNKDGLYINIIESIVSYGLSSIIDNMKKVQFIDSFSLEEKITLYEDFLKKYVEFLHSENVPKSFIVLMLKEQTVPHSKFGETYSKSINVLYDSMLKVLASIYNKKTDDKTVIFEIMSVIGQIVGTKLIDRGTLYLLNQEFYTDDDCKRLKKIALSYVDVEIQKIKNKVSQF